MVLSVDSPSSDRILCYYVNLTAQLQKAAIANNLQIEFERVLFPQQRLLFEANPEAMLEVCTSAANGEPICALIPCLQLKVHERHDSNFAPLPTVLEPELLMDLEG